MAVGAGREIERHRHSGAHALGCVAFTIEAHGTPASSRAERGWSLASESLRRPRFPIEANVVRSRRKSAPKIDFMVRRGGRSEGNTSALQSLIRIAYAVIC